MCVRSIRKKMLQIFFSIFRSSIVLDRVALCWIWKHFFFKMEALHWSWMHCVVPIIFMLNLETLKLEALCWCWKHCVEPGSMGFNYLALVWTLKSFELILEALCWNWRYCIETSVQSRLILVRLRLRPKIKKNSTYFFPHVYFWILIVLKV